MLLWRLNFSFTRVELELDSKLVVDDISNKLAHNSEVGIIVNACRSLLSTQV